MMVVFARATSAQSVVIRYGFCNAVYSNLYKVLAIFDRSMRVVGSSMIYTTRYIHMPLLPLVNARNNASIALEYTCGI
jgi:hypothetical protein